MKVAIFSMFYVLEGPSTWRKLELELWLATWIAESNYELRYADELGPASQVLTAGTILIPS